MRCVEKNGSMTRNGTTSLNVFFFFFFVSGLEKNEGENRTKARKTSVSNIGNDRWTATYATLCLINNDTPGLSMIPQFLT